MHSGKTYALFLGIALLGIPFAHADTTLSTVGSWNGTSGIAPFGAPNTSTYGETFIAPTDSVLQNFTFYLDGATGAQVTFNPAVYAWSGSLQASNPPQGATGPAVYFGPSETVTGNGAFNAVTISTGGVDLTPGDAYVILFTITAADASASSPTTGFSFGLTPHEPGDGGGGFNFINNGTNLSLINTTPWDDFENVGDLAFTANFTGATPEPSSLALFGTALAGFACLARRRIRA